ncbi:MAG TPA: class I adenylate-forming enzyme family protein, partial [Mycobacterium sp.]
MADLLRRAAGQHPDRPAVIAASGSRTWAQLDEAADAGVTALRSIGLDRGERVVIALPTGADLAAALFACARAGMIAVPIGPSHGDTGAVADRVGAVAAISVDHDHGLPVGLDQHDVAKWWAAEPADSPPAASGGGEDLAVLARARADRAVMLSHRSILAAVGAIGRLDDRRVRDADRVLQVLPMYHVAGWVVAFLPTTLVGGATVIPEVGFDSATISVGAPDGALRGSPEVVAAGRRAAESAVAAAGEHDVTVVPGAPGFFHHLVGMDGARRSLATVRLLTSGTAPLDTDDFGAVQTLIGHPVWEGYGLSEAASVVASTLMTDEPRHGSVGKPLTGIELRIVGPDGQDVNAGDGVQPTETEAAELSDPLDV